MSSVDFFASSRVLIVAGKGGVGKTTVGATIGLAASRAGLDVLLLELEGHSNLGAPFGVETLAYEEVTLTRRPGGGRLRGRQITPDLALHEYLEDSGLAKVTNRLARTGAVEVIATAAPGIRDLLALGKIRQLEEAGIADLIVVDAPAAGHAITFLRAPLGFADSTTSGPVHHQADQVIELFGDADRCQVVLVTTPEEAPITEAIETAYSLEDEVGIKLGPLVVNNTWPPIDGLAEACERGDADDPVVQAARFRLNRIDSQLAEVGRLDQGLPLPRIELPYLFTTTIGEAEIDSLASAFVDQLER